MSLVMAALAGGLTSTMAIGHPLDSEGLLLAALAAILACLVLTIPRVGVLAPTSLLGMALAVYFPLRGLLLLVAPLSIQDGVNPRVLFALHSEYSSRASLMILALSLVFFAVTVVGTRGSRMARPPRVFMAPWGHEICVPLVITGLACQAMLTAPAFAYLENQPASGGIVSQMIQVGAFGLYLGVIGVVAHPSRVGPMTRWLVGIAIVVAAALAFYRGSKDGLFQLLLALIAARGLQARLSARQIAAACTVACVSVAVLFPLIGTYRRDLQAGYSAGAAALATPGDLMSLGLNSGAPRSGPFVSSYMVDSLLNATARLHGFDSLVIAAQSPPDTALLSIHDVALLPLGTVLPASVWANSIQDVGLYWARYYWGLSPDAETRIGAMLFGQAVLAFGVPGLVLSSMAISVLAVGATRLLNWRSVSARALAFTIMTTSLSFERDALSLFVPMERHVAVVVVLLILTNRITSLNDTHDAWQPGATAKYPL